MWPLLAATYFMVSGGPYGLEEIIGVAGYGWALIILFVLPFFWSLPTSAHDRELAAAGAGRRWLLRVGAARDGTFLGLSRSVAFARRFYLRHGDLSHLFVTYLGHLQVSTRWLQVGHREY